MNNVALKPRQTFTYKIGQCNIAVEDITFFSSVVQFNNTILQSINGDTKMI